MPNLKTLSKDKTWTTNDTSFEAIKISCLMRIADASEATAKNFRELESDRDLYRRWYNEQRDRAARLERRLTATRGVVTRQRKKIFELQKGANDK